MRGAEAPDLSSVRPILEGFIIMQISEVTTAGLAAMLGLSERRVATVKGEGRLPLTSAGKIDLAELVRRGWAATLASRGEAAACDEPSADERKALGVLAPAFDFTAPRDRGFAMAALLALHEAPICAAIALSEIGAQRATAERAGGLVLLLLWEMLNEHAASLGVPDSGTEGPIYGDDAATLAGWRERVNWPALFDAEGRGIIAARPGDAGQERDERPAR